MELKLPVPILVAATALALISCGGGGGGSKPLSQTGRAVQEVQRLSIMSMSKSGIALAPFMMHGFGGGTSGGTTGSGGGYGGVSNIGFFFRHFGGSSSGGTTGSGGGFAGDTTGGTGGTSGTTGTNGGNGSNFYFDEWLGLWVDVAWSENSSTTTFTLDQEKTLPAGQVTSTYTGDFGSYPQTYSNEYEFTAGPLAGSYGTYNCTQTTETHGSMAYENTYDDGSTDSGESSWTDQTSSFESRWDGADQNWFEDSGTWNADNSGTYTCSTSEGWASNWTYNADWSGSATFNGPDPLLPATMTWTSEGRYTVTYADGSSESWDWEDFWGDVGEGGTTGSGSSSTSAGTSTTG